MNEFFASVKADLTDRRLLPIVAAVCALVIAALAYALLGGGGSSSPSSAPVPTPQSQLPTGIAVTGAQARTAVAETTDGFSDQKHGVARNPFAPLPGSAPPATSTVASTPSSSGSSGTSSSSTGGESESSSGPVNESPAGATNTPSEENAPKRAKIAYDVTIKLGTLPPGVTPETANLHEYENLRLQTPLPSAQVPLLIFRGVTAKGRSATFTLLGEAILTGAGTCLPSPLQCQAVNLKPGETEQLNAIGPNGESTIYELRVLKIEAQKTKASGAKASAARRDARSEGWGVSRAGQKLLRETGLAALPFMHYSSQPGVLVFAKPKAKKAPAGA